MSVRIQLDKPHAPFTNLDIISGVVVLSLLGPETISNINVKLEGESRSRLAGSLNPRGTYDPYERDQAQLEVHKLLYKVSTVFPTQDLLRTGGTNQSYTLPPGAHTYPFQFKFPFNNDCNNNNSMLTNFNALRLEVARNTRNHVKKTLPPSLNGLPGEAEIRYFVKVTVQRPAFYKENFRSTLLFTFLPIEPPRQPPNRRESFARRSHQFSPSIDRTGKPGLFQKSSKDPSVPDIPPPSISIEARLPDPPIATCNEALPLRILVTKLTETPATIYLETLNVLLIGYTMVRAHELRRHEAGSWVIVSLANIHKPLNNTVSTSNGSVLAVDPSLWNALPLPNTVCPTFETCNISRHYELEVKVGLSWGSSNNINPELTVQPLRMAVQVYSGIAPPQALLEQIASRPARPTTQPPYMASNLRPPGSVSGHSPNPLRPSAPQPPSDHVEPSPSDIPDEAPPSYEDAMADDLAPIDGPRRDYHQATTQPLRTDGKGSTGDGRLFPDSEH